VHHDDSRLYLINRNLKENKNMWNIFFVLKKLDIEFGSNICPEFERYIVIPESTHSFQRKLSFL
jgi:hypothetical protein